MAFKFSMENWIDDLGEDQGTGPKKAPQKVKRIDPFDIEAAKIDFEPYRKKIAEMKHQAELFEVTDAVSNDMAITMMGQARNLSKAINGLKDEKLKPHNQFRTQLIGFAKSFTGALEDSVRMLRKKTEDYAYQQVIEQRKREKAEREAAQKRQAEMDRQAQEAGVESIHLPEVPVDQGNKVQVRTETGASISVQLEWKGQIVDPDQVPREYCSPDQKKIDEAVKAGVREMAGVEITEVPKSRLRA